MQHYYNVIIGDKSDSHTQHPNPVHFFTIQSNLDNKHMSTSLCVPLSVTGSLNMLHLMNSIQ